MVDGKMRSPRRAESSLARSATGSTGIQHQWSRLTRNLERIRMSSLQFCYWSASVQEASTETRTSALTYLLLFSAGYKTKPVFGLPYIPRVVHCVNSVRVEQRNRTNMCPVYSIYWLALQSGSWDRFFRLYQDYLVFHVELLFIYFCGMLTYTISIFSYFI